MDDIELLDAWQRGESGAGSELFERHFDAIYRFFDNKVRGDVSDLVQRTFLACIEARDRFERKASFRSFLFGVARIELRSYYRARQRDDRVDFGVSSIADLAPTPSSLVRAHGEQRRLLEALASIPVDLQIAVELHYWEGLSGPELARVLELPEGTVRSRLRRAREQLLDKLSELGTDAERYRDDFETQIRSAGELH